MTDLVDRLRAIADRPADALLLFSDRDFLIEAADALSRAGAAEGWSATDEADYAAKHAELLTWTGSAFLAGETHPSDMETKGRLYSFLCSLLGYLLPPLPAAPTLSKMETVAIQSAPSVVKALEWRWHEGEVWWLAPTSIGQYTILDRGSNWTDDRFRLDHGDKVGFGHFATHEAVVFRAVATYRGKLTPVKTQNPGLPPMTEDEARERAEKIVREHVRGVRPTLTHSEMVDDITAALLTTYADALREAGKIANEYAERDSKTAITVCHLAAAAIIDKAEPK